MKRCRPLLGTYVEISISDSDDQSFDESVIAEAFGEIELVQQLMSFHDVNSDLSRINTFAYHAPVKVHPWTYEVLEFAKKLSIDSYGAFNCAIAPELQEWGKLPKFDYELDDEDQFGASLDDLELLGGNMVAFEDPMKIDLGGIAKGFAVDVALDVLRDYEIEHAVINAGGDIGVIGELPQPIYIRNPSDPGKLMFIGNLVDAAIATSGTYYSKDVGDSDYSSIVVPDSGRSVLDALSFSVIAPSCMAADALTKPLAIHKNMSAPYFNKYQAIGLIS